jgi:hypothetical protein
MIKDTGRVGGLVSEFNLCRVALAGPNLQSVGTEFKALLVVARDDLLQNLGGEFFPGFMKCIQKRLNGNPAANL